MPGAGRVILAVFAGRCLPRGGASCSAASAGRPRHSAAHHGTGLHPGDRGYVLSRGGVLCGCRARRQPACLPAAAAAAPPGGADEPDAGGGQPAPPLAAGRRTHSACRRIAAAPAGPSTAAKPHLCRPHPRALLGTGDFCCLPPASGALAAAFGRQPTASCRPRPAKRKIPCKKTWLPLQ